MSCKRGEGGMHGDELVFVINEKERIRVFLSCRVDGMLRWDWIDAEYIHDDVCRYDIYVDDHFGDFIDISLVALKQALTGGCALDESLREDLGYLWNVYLAQRANDQVPYGWIGQRYLLWETQALDMWLYEKDGKVFFEITPGYRWHFLEPEPEKEGYTTFEQFIKSYKPCVITELSTEAISGWLKQIEHLQAVVKINHERLSRGDKGGLCELRS